MVDCMALLKPDAMTGHWEFTLGAERVKEIADKLGFPFLAQNIRDTEWNEPAFEPIGDVRARRRQGRGDRPGLPLYADRQSALDDPELVVRHPRRGYADATSRRRGARARSWSCCCRTTASTSTASSPARVAGIDVILTATRTMRCPMSVTVGKTMLVASGSARQVRLAPRSRRAGRAGCKGYRFRLIPMFADAIAPDAADGREDRRRSARRIEKPCWARRSAKPRRCSTAAATSTARSTM